jgi:integrase
MASVFLPRLATQDATMQMTPVPMSVARIAVSHARRAVRPAPWRSYYAPPPSASGWLTLVPAYSDHDLVFCRADGAPWHPRTFSDRFEKLVARTEGIPRVRFHDLRHTSATLLLSQGIATKVVSERLGSRDHGTDDRHISARHSWDGRGRGSQGGHRAS